MRQRELTQTQLTGILAVGDGEVRVRWGMTVEPDSPVANNTLWSLEDRGLVYGPRSEVGKAKLTGFGRQIYDLIGDAQSGTLSRPYPYHRRARAAST